MSAICPNCNARLSCGCQRKKASDGATVCSHCFTRYESNLKSAANATPTSPTNVHVAYNQKK
jgi:transcription elongation factor Elf1